jgi:hypothetical protein
MRRQRWYATEIGGRLRTSSLWPKSFLLGDRALACRANAIDGTCMVATTQSHTRLASRQLSGAAGIEYVEPCELIWPTSGARERLANTCLLVLPGQLPWVLPD